MREQEKKGEEAVAIDRAAWEFMKFLLSPEQMSADFGVSGDFLARAGHKATINPWSQFLEKELVAYGV